MNKLHMVTFRTEETIARLFKAYCKDKGVTVTWALSTFMAMAVSAAFEEDVETFLSETLTGATCYQQEFIVIIRNYMRTIFQEVK